MKNFHSALFINEDEWRKRRENVLKKIGKGRSHSAHVLSGRHRYTKRMRRSEQLARENHNVDVRQATREGLGYACLLFLFFVICCACIVSIVLTLVATETGTNGYPRFPYNWYAHKNFSDALHSQTNNETFAN